MATNPAVSMPDAGAVRDALAACPFVVVSDCVARTDTLAYAHVALPASAWGEKDGTVTNSERRISRQRPRSEEHTSELQSLMRISYAVFCLKKKNNNSSTDKNLNNE